VLVVGGCHTAIIVMATAGADFASLHGGLGEATTTALTGKMDAMFNRLKERNRNYVMHTSTQQRKECRKGRGFPRGLDIREFFNPNGSTVVLE
jgi:hypothetical protein